MPSRQSGGALPGPALPPRQFTAELPPRTGNFEQRASFSPGELPARGGPERGGLEPRGFGPRGPEREAFPVRQPTMRPPRRTEGGRHRRPVPASLPQSAPALILAVPGRDADLSGGPAGELTSILRVDNPAV